MAAQVGPMFVAIWDTMPATQVLWRRGGQGGCLIWLAAPAVVLVTIEGMTGDCGLDNLHFLWRVWIGERGCFGHRTGDIAQFI